VRQTGFEQDAGRKKSFMMKLGVFVGASLLSLGVGLGESQAQNLGVVRGRVLVKAKPGFSAEDAARPYSGRKAGEIPALGVAVLQVPDHAFEHAIQGLRRNPNIEFAEPDAYMAPGGVANDPYFNNSWHLAKTQATTAWDTTTGSSSVIIAILDTGVDGTHPDLSGKLVAGWNAYSGNTVTADVTGHGTGVAGVAAAAANNGIGVSSVAWNCKIMPVRISDAAGYAMWSTTASALTWAADHGARVANISFVGASSSATVQNAANYFQGKGGVVASCAGNGGNLDSSAETPYILTVSATDPNDVLTSFSTYGNFVDLSAPGTNIWSTTRGGGYGGWWGTSVAAPQVAGAAALMLSVQPGLSAAQIQDILKNTSDDLGPSGWDNRYGKGRLNVQRAVATALATSPAPAPAPTPTPTPTADTTAPTIAITSPAANAVVTGNVQVRVNAADNVRVTKVDLLVNGKLTAAATAAPFTTTWSTRKLASGAYNLQTKAYDAAGNTALSAIVSVRK